MTLVKINTAKVSADLPVATPFAGSIYLRPSLRSWWRVQDDKVTLEGGVVSGLAQNAGASALPLTQASAGSRPILEQNKFMGRYPSITFDGTNDWMRTTSLPYTRDGAFSWVFIGTMRSNAGNANIATVFNTVGSSTILRVNAGGTPCVFQHGNGTCSISEAATGPIIDRPVCIIATSSATQLNLQVNRVNAAPSATNNAQTASIFIIGASNTSGLQPAPLDFGEFMIFQEDISSDEAFMKTINDYARLYYGAV